jgi:hypothetical protein
MQPSLQLSRCTWISHSPGTRFESRFQIHIAMRSSVGAESPSTSFSKRWSRASWVSEPIDVIQQAMVEGILGVADRCRQVVEMKNVPGGGIRLALDDHASAERMAMHARVRRPRRGRWQKMRRFELEILVNSHAAQYGISPARATPSLCWSPRQTGAEGYRTYGIPRILWVCTDSRHAGLALQ